MLSRFCSLFLFAALLNTQASAVVNYEGVAWNASPQAFVTSAYVAVFGSSAPPNVVSAQAAKLKNRGDRYRFVKWLLERPEYMKAFGDPHGDYQVLKNPHTDVVAVTRDFPPEGFTVELERRYAWRPAMLLKSFYQSASPTGSPAVASTGASASPAGGSVNGITVQALIGARYDVYSGNSKSPTWHVEFTGEAFTQTPSNIEKARTAGFPKTYGYYTYHKGVRQQFQSDWGIAGDRMWYSSYPGEIRSGNAQEFVLARFVLKNSEPQIFRFVRR